MSTKHTYLDDEKYTYDYFHQNNVCRLCWSANNIIKSVENDSVITEKILEYIGIDVTSSIPNKVCNICLNKILTFIDFKKSCEIAEKKLENILLKTFEEHYNDPAVLKKEADFEMKLLAKEVKREQLHSLVLKQENDLEEKDSCDYDDLFPKEDNYCYTCNMNFDSTDALIKHNIGYHKTESYTYNCFRCKKEFQSFAVKLNHDLFLCKDVEQLNCSICKINFSTYKSFESHLRAHANEEQVEKANKCNKCSMVFKTGRNLRKHLLVHKREENKEKIKEKCVCEVCGQMHTKNNMHVHMLTHTRNKQFKCPHCEYQTTLSASLNTHIKLHTGERPFACEQCPYRCITSSNLNKHRKTHTGLKEYTCHICKKEYRHNTSLRDHISSTHQGDRKYKCKQCGSQYFHFKGLRKHMLTKHGRKVKKIKDDFIEIDKDTYTRSKSNKEGSGMSHKDGMTDEDGRQETGTNCEHGMSSEARVIHEIGKLGKCGMSQNREIFSSVGY